MDVFLVEEIELEDEQWAPILELAPLADYRLSPINRVVYEIYDSQDDWSYWVLYESEA